MMKQGSQEALAFPSQIARCEEKEEGSKDRNQVMLRMGGKGKVEKTLKRDGKGENATEGGNMCPPLPGHRQLSHVQLIGKRIENADPGPQRPGKDKEERETLSKYRHNRSQHRRQT